ncbi:carbohydrate sulfotransferase 11-like [Pogonomyrmex barbatus]|uniref:Carbohydrate sulfotransferase n=1 Tax=Pogonomyrmex barbatus TaxID=144034 RepID=A0A6I9W5D8_9HYME|nr:carbohydrate sulfotransferase 11-like [Pogonomyrmex barbatus]
MQKKVTIVALTSSDNENLIIYPRSLKSRIYHILKKLIQRQVTLTQPIIQIIILAAICIITLLTLTNLVYTKTNTEPATSLRYASSVFVERIPASRTMFSRVTISSDQMENVRQEFDNRRRKVARMCDIIGMKTSHLNTTLMHMVIDVKHNLSWCPIRKAASSTWMNNFILMQDIPPDFIVDLMRRNWLRSTDVIRQKFQQNMNVTKIYENMNRTKTFLIVRHPLERLLSAYRDKFEHVRNHEHYYKRFGQRIVLKYRQSNITKLEPTFEEFLLFIINERYFDEHWMPYYRFCKPCTIHYNYILKFETLDRDQNFLIQDMNLNKYLHEKNNVQNMNPRGTTTRQVLDNYIKDIPQSLLHEIYKIYENDYKLFDYSFNIF